MAASAARQSATTVDRSEIARFSALAESWWDPDGPFRPLHRLNPVRLGWIREQAGAHFGLDPTALRPLDGLDLLDVGCGGGLLCEPMARLGARVTGIDASARNIGVARAHAEAAGLAIDYRDMAAEDLAAEDLAAKDLAKTGTGFDVILNMEVVEHVADLDAFLGACAALLRPGGMMVLATLNRTPKSFALAIVGAEYLLRWLPRGTHDWRRFVRPSELVAGLERNRLKVGALVGVGFNPLTGAWSVGRDLSVNYMAAATPRAAPARGAAPARKQRR